MILKYFQFTQKPKASCKEKILSFTYVFWQFFWVSWYKRVVFYCVFVVLLRDGAVELGGHGHFRAAVGPLWRPLLLPLCGDGVPGGDRECLQSGHYSAPHHLCPLRSSRQHHCMCRGTAQVHCPHSIPLQIILPKTNTCILLLFPHWSEMRRI